MQVSPLIFGFLLCVAIGETFGNAGIVYVLCFYLTFTVIFINLCSSLLNLLKQNQGIQIFVSLK